MALFVSLSLSISLHAAPPLSVYGKQPSFERAAISQSGDHIALIGTTGDLRRLIILDKNTKPVMAVSIGAAKVRGLYWAGDGMVLLETSNTANLGIGFTADKAELYSMLVIPIGGGKPWSVFDKNPSIRGGIRGFHGLNQRDGKWYGYFGGITFETDGKVEPWLKSARPVLYEVDLQTRKNKKLAPRVDDQENYRTWLIGPDGKVSVTFDFRSIDGNWRLTNAQGEKIATGIDKFGNVGLVGFGPKADTVIYTQEDQETGRERWMEVPITGGSASEILADMRIGGSFFDNRTRQLMGYRHEGDVPTYQFFNRFHQKVVEATQKAFPGVSVRLIDWNDAFNRLIVMTEGVNDPQTWWQVDIRTGKADVLGTSYPIAAEDVAPMKMIHYKAGDGKDIAAVLTLPPQRAAKNLPVIIFPHGGPASRDYPGFDWWAQAFAARGYAVLQPNFRGSTGYGADFERAGHGEWGRKMQTDISDGLAQLVKDGIADPKRACIMGASYGGYAALAGVTLQHGLYRCAVSFAGVSDVQKMVNSDISESGGNNTLRRTLKREVGSGRDLRDISPIRHVDNVDAPVLLIHGKDDTVVLYDQSTDMAAALRRAGKTVEFITLPGEDHWLSNSDTRLTMLQAAVTFVEKYNPPDPPK
ncbi:alpha/beta hydrolase family protein [Sphingobium fluviale]|uniref:S9 family peptidase n=1 Tax=Sphingobium fluviale TaxID=2506423 RepID=A0A4Q1KJ45_9SPHN|nr:S9 family peptidase [Sphingobium fluviale]RXR29169.1 S9 family peptidase [Sphingobium fluviale]